MAEIIKSVPGNPTTRRPDVVAITQEAVRIPSHNDVGTQGVVEYFESQANQYGFDTLRIPTLDSNGQVISQHPNLVIGRNLHTLPVVFQAAHIDTVYGWNVGREEGQGTYDPYLGQITDGKVYGRGTSDSKGGAAAMFAAMAERKDELPDSVGLLLTAREETDLRGLRSSADFYQHIQQLNPNAKTELIVASGSDSEFSTGSRGVLEAEFTLEGKSGHTGRPVKFTPVDDVRDEVIRGIREEIAEIAEHNLLGRSVMYRTGDESGFYDGNQVRKPVNQVPNWAWALLGGRLNGMPLKNGEELNPDSLQKMIERKVNEYQAEGTRLSNFGLRAFIRAAISSPEKVDWIVDLAKKITGKDLKPWNYGERGLEEMIEFVNVLTYKASLIVLGPGKQGTYHEPDEYAEVQSLRDYTEIYGQVLSDPQFRTFGTVSSAK